MRSAPIVCLILLIVVLKVPHAAALPILTPLPGVDRHQPPPPDGSCGKVGADREAVVSKANPDASGKYHVGDGVSAPRLVFGPIPELPSRKNLAGSVVVSLTVDVFGKPQNVCVSRSLVEDVGKKHRSIALVIDESVLDAVKQYRFEPAEFQGKPVAVETTLGIHFGIY